MAGALASVDDRGADGEGHGHRPPGDEIVGAAATRHRRNRVQMLEEVVDANDHGQDQHHQGDGVTAASPGEVLAHGRLGLERLGLPGLGAPLLPPPLDLPLLATVPAAAGRAHRPSIRHAVGRK